MVWYIIPYPMEKKDKFMQKIYPGAGIAIYLGTIVLPLNWNERLPSCFVPDKNEKIFGKIVYIMLLDRMIYIEIETSSFAQRKYRHFFNYKKRIVCEIFFSEESSTLKIRFGQNKYSLLRVLCDFELTSPKNESFNAIVKALPSDIFSYFMKLCDRDEYHLSQRSRLYLLPLEERIDGAKKLLSFFLASDKQEWMREFLRKEEKFPLSEDNNWSGKKYRCNPFKMIRMLAAGIQEESDNVVVVGSSKSENMIGIMTIQNLYPHLICVTPFKISIYDVGDKSSFVAAMKDDFGIKHPIGVGYDYHPLTRLIFWNMLLKKNPSMIDHYMDNYHGKLASDCFKYGFVKESVAFFDFETLTKCFKIRACVGCNCEINHDHEYTHDDYESECHHSRCEVSCNYEEEYIGHIVALGLIQNGFSDVGFKTPNTKGFFEINFPYRGKRCRTRTYSDGDTIITSIKDDDVIYLECDWISCARRFFYRISWIFQNEITSQIWKD